MKYRDKQNLKFIKNKIEQENISTPDSLSSENILNLLDDRTKETPVKNIKSKHTAVKRIVSIAACIAVVVSAVSVYNHYNKNNIKTGKTSYGSYNELKKVIDKIQSENEEIWLEDFEEYPVNEGAIKSETNINSSTNYVYETDGTSHEETYSQVEGVDEADIIKNDGKYIYVADSYKKIFLIYETEQDEVTLVSSTYVDDTNEIYDMYLYDNKLILNCDCYYADYYAAKTTTVIYDISDKTKPEKIKTLTQDGSYISSRIIDNQLYVITNKYVSKEAEEIEDYIPAITCDTSKSKLLPAKDIYCIENPTEPSYVVVSSFDLDNGKQQTDSKAVLGAGSNVYCSENNLYVINENTYFNYIGYVNETSSTNILKFSLNEGNIEFVAQGKVKGYINDQYSLDEKDGYLRISTTYTTQNYDETNGMFIFDENLERVGSVTNFAKGETIQAVKFIGDMAYVITFEQTDPLFVIDLSDPESPEITGEVEITGFSSMLHPVDENTLLGIGYADETLPTGEWVDGIKLALFDISDPANPTVLDSVIFKNCYSQAQYNPKAFMVNNDVGYYAIPFESYYTDIDVSGAKTFEIKDGKIEVTNSFIVNDCYHMDNRCTYIDDYVYIIFKNDMSEYVINSFKYSK